MRAVLLCAGFGTRLQPLTDDTPKPLLPVAGRPMVDYLVTQIAAWPETDALHVVHTARHAEAFAAWADAWRDRGVALTLHNNGVTSNDEKRGAVGDLGWALRRVGTVQPIVVAGGDSIYRVSLRPFAERLRDGDAHVVAAIHQPDADLRAHSSVLHWGLGNRVTGVTAAGADVDAQWISPALLGLQPSGAAFVEPYLDAGGDPDTLGAFTHALAQREPVAAWRLPRDPDVRLHINTPAQYRRANDLLQREPVRL